MLLVEHGAPQGTLSPNRVYNIDCINDENALRRLMVTYDARLRETADAIENEIRQLSVGSDRPLTNAEVKAAYCAPVTIPVSMESDFSSTKLFANKSAYGLSADCPEDEDRVWMRQYRDSQDAFYQLMKQPRRGLSRATDLMQGLNVDLSRVKLLDRFQLEDVDAFVGRMEKEMIDIDVPDIFNVEPMEKAMEKENSAIKAKIETRMSRKATVLLGALVLFVALLGFVPLIAANIDSSVLLGRSLIIVGSVVALLAVTGVICLFYLRSALSRSITDFNTLMTQILRTVEGSMSRFSRYLSDACGFMHGASVMNFYHESDDRLTHEIRVRKMHEEDIKTRRETLYEIFGIFMSDLSYVDTNQATAYLYDFSRQVEFDYPLPYTDGTSRSIGYFEDSCKVSIPVDFIRRVSVRLEELYE